MSSTDPLLTPFTIKHLTLRNRIVSTSHEPSYSENGLPTDRYRAYHVAKAKGGVGLTMIGGSALVSRDSAPAFGNLQLWKDEAVPWLRRLTDEVHGLGTAVMTQLTHLGHRTSNYSDNWLPAVSVTRVRESAHRAFTREAELFDLERIARDFAETARRCKEGGLDGVELMTYGHLLDSFWTPLRNRRADEYGGSFENRMRFPLQVVRGVREAVGDDFLLGVRMTFDEGRDGGGVTPEEGVRIARLLIDEGIDFISAVTGFIDTDYELGVQIPPMGTPAAPHLEAIGAIKKQLDVPIMHAGRIADVATARYAIAEGLLDLVGMTRALIADPELVNKVAERQEDLIRPCVGANMCIDGIYTSGASYCVHNASTGRELQLPHKVGKAAQPKKVAVVGGGPAGLEAARTLAERGHEVVLHEASDRLGGQVNLAATSARRRDLLGIVEWRVSELRRLGVTVRLNSYVEGADLADAGYDVVIVATGGLPDTGEAEGIELATDSWDVLSGDKKLTGDVIVYDDNGFNPALDVTEALTGTARSVRFITPERTLAPEVGTITLTKYLQMMADAEVSMTPVHRLRRIEKVDGRLLVTFAVDGASKTVQHTVDAVVSEHGTVPVTDVYDELVDGSVNHGEIVVDELLELTEQTAVRNPDGHYRLYRIGDAVASRSIQSAVLDAFRLCSAI